MWGKEPVKAKSEFVRLATQDGANIRALCRRFGVSPTSAYRQLDRFKEEGEAGLQERSRRPHHSPTRTPPEVEQAVLAMRDESHWGGRKISHVLRRDVDPAMPPRSTVNKILKRNGRITVEASEAAKAHIRFERAEPNDLSQMDFMGEFETGQGPCHALTMLDDHSRYALCLKACRDQRTETVIEHLTEAFATYGLPYQVTMDNGSPWGEGSGVLTKVTAWMIRVGVRISHSRPYHPQTQGKDERFHQTLQRELTNHTYFRTLVKVQEAFDRFRDRYNLVRPHEALNMAVPASRYRISARSLPAVLPAIEYPTTDMVRKVDQVGRIGFKNRSVRVGRGCVGLKVGIRPTLIDGVFDVYFCAQKVKTIDLRTPVGESADA